MKKIVIAFLFFAGMHVVGAQTLPAPETLFPTDKSVVPPGVTEFSWKPQEGAAAFWLQAEFLEKFGWEAVVDVYVPPLNAASFGMNSTGSARWRVAAVDSQGVGGKWAEWVEFRVGERILSVQELPGMPESFRLAQNYPNPFNPTTTIRFELFESAPVKLVVVNTLGQEVATLVDDQLGVGKYEVTWDGKGLPSGAYFYRLTSNGLVQTRRMVLVK